MATTRATAGRPGTRTPDALATPSTPPAIEQRRSTRERKQTTNFAQQQEEDSGRRATKPRHKRSLPSETLRGNTVVNPGTDTNQSNANEIQDLLAEVKSPREEIRHNHIEHQEEIHKVRTECQESLAAVQQELEEIKNEIRSTSTGLWSCDGHEELRQELRSLHRAVTAPSTSNSQPTWASIVAGQSNPIGNDSRTIQNRRDKEAHCVRISTHQRDATENRKESFGRYLPVEVANAHIREALSNSDTMKDARVAGVGTTATGYAIRFQDAESAETAKASSGWLQRLGNGTKLVRPRYGVVVHRTPTEDFPLPGDERSAITKITEENGLEEHQFSIVEVAWLRRKDKPQGRFGSLAIWFDSPEAVEWMVQNGRIVGLRYIGNVEPYQVKRKRCHRCQRFGHLARTCQEKPRCGHCAEDHEKRSCPPGVNPRCLDCKGDHPTGDRRCQNPLLDA